MHAMICKSTQVGCRKETRVLFLDQKLFEKLSHTKLKRRKQDSVFFSNFLRSLCIKIASLAVKLFWFLQTHWCVNCSEHSGS